MDYKLNPKKALILVAHADDETLGAGGLIQKLLSEKWEINIVILSDGIRTQGSINKNFEDTFKACNILGISQKPIFIGLKDQFFDTYPIAEISQKVINLKLNPDLIITHVDTDLNLDHRITLDVAKILGRPKNKPISIIGCEIPNTSFWNTKLFNPNYYVDISNYLDKKISAFEQYTHEIGKFPHPWSQKGLKLLAEYHGMQCGYKFAEAFHIYRANSNHLI